MKWKEIKAFKALFISDTWIPLEVVFSGTCYFSYIKVKENYNILQSDPKLCLTQYYRVKC